MNVDWLHCYSCATIRELGRQKNMHFTFFRSLTIVFKLSLIIFKSSSHQFWLLTHQFPRRKKSNPTPRAPQWPLPPARTAPPLEPPAVPPEPLGPLPWTAPPLERLAPAWTPCPGAKHDKMAATDWWTGCRCLLFDAGFLQQQTINLWIKIAGWICGPLLFNPILPNKTHRIFLHATLPNKKINCIHHFPSNPPLFGRLCLWNHCRCPEHQNMTSFLVDCFFRLKPEREKSHSPKRQEHPWNRQCPKTKYADEPTFKTPILPEIRRISVNFRVWGWKVLLATRVNFRLSSWAIWSYKSGWSWSDPPSHSWNLTLRAFLYTSSDIISYLTPNVWHVCNGYDIYR